MCKDRENMTVEEEREFVKSCFEEYEKEGFAEIFSTPYTDYKSREGYKFTVIRRVMEDEVDLECLPIWKIKFEDGKEINAYPEEIIPSEVDKWVNDRL